MPRTGRGPAHEILIAKGAIYCLAQPRCGFDEGVQHRLQIEGRATDDLEHLGRGPLLLERLSLARG